MFVSEIQFEKARLPIVLKESGSSMLIKLVQPENASSSIINKLFGNIIVSSKTQSLKVLSFISVTPSPI